MRRVVVAATVALLASLVMLTDPALAGAGRRHVVQAGETAYRIGDRGVDCLGFVQVVYARFVPSLGGRRLIP